MPRSALKPCQYPGCPNLVEHGYCDKHRSDHEEDRRGYHRPWQRLYNSARWKQIRARQLAANPWCAEHLKRGEYIMATVCDHVDPHRGDQEKFYSGPFQSLCDNCHNEKTAREVNGRGAKKVSDWGATSARGHSREKNSQCGKSS